MEGSAVAVAAGSAAAVAAGNDVEGNAAVRVGTVGLGSAVGSAVAEPCAAAAGVHVRATLAVVYARKLSFTHVLSVLLLLSHLIPADCSRISVLDQVTIGTGCSR